MPVTIEKPTSRGYEYWSKKPITPSVHTAFKVPQSLYDGWESYCSCGEWRAFASFYEYNTPTELHRALDDAHSEHARLDTDKPSD